MACSICHTSNARKLIWSILAGEMAIIKYHSKIANRTYPTVASFSINASHYDIVLTGTFVHMLQITTTQVFISFDSQWTVHKYDTFNLVFVCGNLRKLASRFLICARSAPLNLVHL